jgi:cytochrome c oxidase subunit IV
MSEGPRSANLYWTAVALGVLLAATVLASRALGAGGPIANLVIAALKAALVAVVFMHLRWSSPLQRLFAGAGLFWLAILFTLTFADYMTRR